MSRAVHQMTAATAPPPERRAPARGVALPAALLLACLATPAAPQAETGYSVFAGQMSDNEWGEFFDDWGSIRFRDATTFGVGVNREWPVWRLGYLGTELQVLGWVGEQRHLEFTLPLTIRTPRTESPYIPSLAYGVGLSYATSPPESEIARTGESTELLAHWFFEIEFGGPGSDWRPYLRLHHRSHAWEAFDARTGSNALLVGVRWTQWPFGGR